MQFTRDALIDISGAREKGRDFVYFTDVKNIPSTDLATIERLWTKFSGGKFGYSVQKVRIIFACRAGQLVCLFGHLMRSSSIFLDTIEKVEAIQGRFRSLLQKNWVVDHRRGSGT